ncbi:hypothetical protein [Limnobacter sp.]|uniref:hypothetical protein n=1 Tax=Limnobacter sp. TaxID=2003368 RepID=UPI0027348373|nr:hypothetical protein [Limnobacter sp.]MDP3188988.1 hypothetical protein [Limnobacter sp.]
MLKWNQLHQQLETMANRHSQLAAKFQSFAKFVEQQVTDSAFHIKGISASLHLEQGYFTTTFADRTLRFTFSSVLSESGSLVGTVTCSLMKDFPEKSLVPVGEFTFTGSGKTNLNNPEDGDPIIIDADIPALYLGLHFIYEGLSK